MIDWARVIGALALVVAALGIVTFAAQRVRSDLESAGAAKLQAQQAQSDALEANRRAGAVSKVAHDAQLQNDSSLAAAARASDALVAERLRVDAYVRAHSIHPAAAGASAPEDPIGVFSELQRRFDEAAGRYAAEADANRIAGLACERSYDALRP